MSEKFANTGILFRHFLKRDWKKIIIWLLGLSLFSGAYLPAFEEIAKGSGLLGMFETMQNPAMIAIVGPTPITTGSDYTIGAMYGQEMLLFCALFAAIISGLHVVSHTRKEEEAGLMELVRSFKVGRLANSLALMLEILLIHLLLVVVTFGIMMSFSIPTVTTSGVLVFSLALGYAGILGGVLGLIFAQIMTTSTGANGAFLGVLGGLYLLRATTDISQLSLSKINPLSWTYLTYPFTENKIWPLVAGAILNIFLLGVAFVLEGKRDLGAGYLPEREGRATAKKSLLSVFGLLTRLNRGMIFAWLITFLVMGAAYGSIYGDMQSFLESNELMKAMFTQSGSSLEATFTGTIMTVIVSLGMILPIAVINKTFHEESTGRFSQLYVSKMTNKKLYIQTMILAFLVGSLGIFLGTVGLGGAAISSMGKNPPINWSDFFLGGFNYWPVLLFFMGLSGIFLGFKPSFGKIVYGYLGYSFALNYFSGILNLPSWLQKTDILSWFKKVPAEKISWSALLVVSLIGLVLIFLGFLGYVKRDRQESI